MFIEEVILGHTWRGWGRDSSGGVGGTEGQVREHLLPEQLRFCLQGGECILVSSDPQNCPLQEEEARVFVLQLPSLMGAGLTLCSAPHCSPLSVC